MTALLQEWVDSGVIMAVVLVNAVVGFLQESKAEAAIESVRQIVTTESTVRRDGQVVRVRSHEIVPGDIVRLQSGDMVLTDDNFASIQAAVEEGRGIFDNLTKFIVWTPPTNLGEGLVILAAIVIGVALPILPVQILWTNMTTAILLGLSLAFEPKETGIMERPPRPPEAPILTRELIIRIGIVGTAMLIGAFGLFEWELINGATVEQARTVAVNVFVIVEMFYLYKCRSLMPTVFKIGFFSNPWAIGGTALMMALQLAYTYVPVMNRFFQSAPIDLYAWLRVFPDQHPLEVIRPRFIGPAFGVKRHWRRGSLLPGDRTAHSPKTKTQGRSHPSRPVA